MQLIKLDAIDSTNDYLKRLSTTGHVTNFTVVTTENQTNGRGQMGSKWVSETGKNLTMSILIKDVLTDISGIYNLNIAVTIGVIKALEKYHIPKLSIKWPNDILSDDKKIGGILIENSIKTSGEVISIIGIGLNINQKNFEDLPKASSVSLIMGTEFDKEEILKAIVNAIKVNTGRLMSNEASKLWDIYLQKLFKKGVPMPFENQQGQQFMGIIQAVSEDGKLQLLVEDDSVQSFGVKEIQMLY